MLELGRTLIRLCSVYWLFLIWASESEAAYWQLRISYDLKCQDMFATLAVAKLQIRGIQNGPPNPLVYLYRFQKEAAVFLGESDSETPPEVSYSFVSRSDYCQPIKTFAQVTPIQPTLALQHYPFIVARRATLNRSGSDALLALGVLEQKINNHTRLTYHAYFTDEDSQVNTLATEMQMGSYGRRTDVEWVYEVTLNSQNEVISRKYQGGILKNSLGHRTRKFEGKLIGSHPVLYLSSANNILSDHPHLLTYPGSDLVSSPLPLHSIDSESTRDQIFYDHPWMLKISDLELMREDRAIHPSTRYLFFGFEGQLSQGSFLVRIRSLNHFHHTKVSGVGLGPKKDPGFLAIRTASQHAIVFSLQKGMFSKQPDLQIRKYSFFRFTPKTYKKVYIDSDCKGDSMNFQCAFKTD